MCIVSYVAVLFFFFFNDTATTEIYTLSLHDALPISEQQNIRLYGESPDGGSEAICHNAVVEDLALPGQIVIGTDSHTCMAGDRKSTRLNSSHSQISYAVFCLKKKNKKQKYHSYRPHR